MTGRAGFVRSVGFRFAVALATGTVLAASAACSAETCGTCADAIEQGKMCGEVEPFCDDDPHGIACNQITDCVRNSCGTACPSGLIQISESGCRACANQACGAELRNCAE